ncbi:50S ribosomal protein L11 [bacterium]|nr:50S ribosomal protein L11 [bacterium]
MMKKILTKVKLQIPAGQANPAPPIGPALAQHGINISDFCQKFNDATKDKAGFKIPVIITIYEDRSFDFELKQPLASDLIKKAAGIEKGSGEPNRKKVGKLTKEQIREIAQTKLPDLSTNDIEKAMKIIEAQAKGMGIEVE